MTVSKFVEKARPTNKDLQDQVGELHGCLHNVDRKVETTSRQLLAIADAMGVRLPTEEELELGVRPKRIGRRLGGMSVWQAAGVAAGVIPAGMAVYKVLEPAVVAFATTLHHALMSAH